MRTFILRAGAGILALVLPLASTPVRADELLVMPYSCAMVGGQPLLTPAPEQGHRIIGAREQRPFTACSPANPEMCRTWTVHRFDLDCEGSRVPWVDVVAAAAEYSSGHAWAENGRLFVRMPRTWSFAPDDPCARGPGFDDRFLFGRMRRYCEDRNTMAPPVVEMPPGYAPMLGIEGIFVKSQGPAVSNAAPSPPAPQTAAPATAAPGTVAPGWPAKVARAEPPPRPEPAPPARGDVPADPAPKEALAKNEPPAQAAIKPPPQAAPPPAQTAKPPHAPATAPPVASSGPVIPKIINRPEAAPGDAAEPPSAAVAVPNQPPAPSPKVEPATPPPGQDASAPPAAPPAAAPQAAKDGPAPVSLLSFARSPTAGAIAAVGGLAIVLLAAFGLARRRERGRPAGAPPHDFASVSLDSPKRGGSLVPRLGEPGPGEGRRQPAPAAPPPVPPAQPAAYGVAPTLIDRIPQTRAEAVQILGIGVTPDANAAAMKKIVDGLRLSWHPDLARDDADRHLREFRMKQINAAWDLIQGRRMERLDS